MLMFCNLPRRTSGNVTYTLVLKIRRCYNVLNIRRQCIDVVELEYVHEGQTSVRPIALKQTINGYLRCSMHRFVKVKSTSASAEIFLTDLSPSMNGIIYVSESWRQRFKYLLQAHVPVHVHQRL